MNGENTLKLSDGKYSAVKQLLWGLSVFANKSKSGYENAVLKLKVTAVSADAQVTDDLVAIEIMSAPQVKGALYSDADIFSFEVKNGTESWLILIEAKLLVSLVENLHISKEFANQPIEGKLMKTPDRKIFGFIPVWVLADNAITSFRVSEKSEEKS